VVSARDPYGRILGLLDRSTLIKFKKLIPLLNSIFVSIKVCLDSSLSIATCKYILTRLE
jgi:hypothetical protein